MQNRRTLHQPFFPLPSSTPPPSSAPPFPKFPSSSTNPQQPFFPNYPSPPPPPPSISAVPTFPANISSLIYPNSNPHSAPHSSSHSKLLPAILFSLMAFSLITLSLAFLFHRRRRNKNRNQHPETHKPKPASDNTASTTSAATRPATSDFLYLGTIVNNGGNRGQIVVEAVPMAQKLGSPELRPLPPLPRTARRNYDNTTDSDEEFYSPKAESDNATTNKSSSMRELEDEKCWFQSYDVSTPSYPDSNSGRSSSPIGSSPAKSGDDLKRSRSGTPPMPPPPPQLGPMRPMTPSPLKRKPPSPSPPFSPTEDVHSRDFSPLGQVPRGSEFLWQKSRNAELLRQHSRSLSSLGQNLTNSEILGQNSSSELVGQNSRNSDILGQNLRNQTGVPPPPPPPPPVGYWESRVRKPSVFAAQKPAALNKPIEFSENLDSIEKNKETTPRPRLKPLHWDKVRASSDRAMVWDQLKSSSFKVNEEMMETLFGCSNMSNAAPKETNRQPHQQHPMIPSPRMENRVLDPKKSQNIAILLRALNVTKEEVCEALLEGNTENLGTELLETLLKMAPSKEEELKLKEFKDESPFKLGPAEKFLKALLDIPFAFKRVDAMLYIANFDSEVSYLKNSFETLEAACEELRNSRLFLKLLEAVLKTGNRMNVGTNRGDAHAFKLDTLLKLVDVKGTDGKTTLLHFVVQEIIRAEGSRLSTTKTQANTLQNELKCKKLGLQVVAGLGNELANVKKAAAMDSEVLSSYVSKLASGIGKIVDVLRFNNTSSQFNEAMSTFLKKAEDEIIRVQAQESVALSLVKEITEYFHGNSAKEEAHPFRIFMVVRDFLSVLDQVCKEVGKINEQSIASSARQFPVPVNPTLPPLFPQIKALRPESSDDESSSSS